MHFLGTPLDLSDLSMMAENGLVAVDSGQIHTYTDRTFPPNRGPRKEEQ